MNQKSGATASHPVPALMNCGKDTASAGALKIYESNQNIYNFAMFVDLNLECIIKLELES